MLSKPGPHHGFESAVGCPFGLLVLAPPAASLPLLPLDCVSKGCPGRAGDSPQHVSNVTC